MAPIRLTASGALFSSVCRKARRLRLKTVVGWRATAEMGKPPS